MFVLSRLRSVPVGGCFLVVTGEVAARRRCAGDLEQEETKETEIGFAEMSFLFVCFVSGMAKSFRLTRSPLHVGKFPRC